MEMQIEIIGCGERKTGIGKNGRPYDFVNCHFTYADKYTDGKACGSFMCPGERFEQYGVRPGVTLNAIVFFKNYAPDKVYIL